MAVIKRELEKEIDLLRRTTARTLEGTEGSTPDRVALGREGEDFKFDQLPMKVEFCETALSENRNEDNFQIVADWITARS